MWKLVFEVYRVITNNGADFTVIASNNKDAWVKALEDVNREDIIKLQFIKRVGMIKR